MNLWLWTEEGYTKTREEGGGEDGDRETQASSLLRWATGRRHRENSGHKNSSSPKTLPSLCCCGRIISSSSSSPQPPGTCATVATSSHHLLLLLQDLQEKNPSSSIQSLINPELANFKISKPNSIQSSPCALSKINFCSNCRVEIDHVCGIRFGWCGRCS